MSKPAFTVHAFGLYLLVLGVTLVLAPNLVLSVSGMPTTTEVWIRVVGILAFNIGIYYVAAARCEARAFFQATVYTRTLVVVGFAAFAALGLASPMLILFGSVDFVGGLWTQWALRTEKRAGA